MLVVICVTEDAILLTFFPVTPTPPRGPSIPTLPCMTQINCNEL